MFKKDATFRLNGKLQQITTARVLGSPRNDGQKAAMFGLDARIALAIFGALSVIIGASLYSAIQQTQAVALLNDLRELGKAWEAYYLDTGTNLTRCLEDDANPHFYSLQTYYLAQPNGVAGWKGPYLTGDQAGYYLTHNKYFQYRIDTLTSDDWAIWYSAEAKCTSGRSCFIWSSINGIDSDSIFKKVDKIVDGEDGPDKGNFRWYDSSDETYKYSVHLKIAPIKNPHD